VLMGSSHKQEQDKEQEQEQDKVLVQDKGQVQELECHKLAVLWDKGQWELWERLVLVGQRRLSVVGQKK